MTNTYKLKTLRDVYEQVPKDKLQACLAEIAQGMLYAHELGELAGGPLQWQEPCEWIDDGKTDKTIAIQNASTGEAELTFVARQNA